MKKTLFTLAVAFSLMGCTHDLLFISEEQILENGNAISFGTYIGNSATSKAATRATIIDKESLGVEGFGVNAFYTKDLGYYDTNSEKEEFMTDTKVTYNSDKNMWTYSPIKYWPNNRNHKVSFFAYGPFSVTEQLDKDKTAIDFTVEPEIKDQVDLIYNTNYNATIDAQKQAVNDRITFIFSHALSRVSFSVELAVDGMEPGNTTLDANTVVNVKQVQLIGPFYQKGTLTLLEPTEENPLWNNLSGEQNFTLNGQHFYRTITADNSEVVQLHKFNQSQNLLNSDSYLMIIPQDLSTGGFNIYIEYDVITKTDDGKDYSCITNCITSETPLMVNFERGKSYNFNLILGMTSVKFNVEVDGWPLEGSDGYIEDDEWVPENNQI